ncbi:PPT2, partial [Cervus elaphus hippelaphus]
MLGLPGRRLPSAEFLLLLPFLLLLLLPAAPAPHRAAYKPVIVVHGLFDSSYSFRHLLEYINEMGQYGDTNYLKWLFPTSMRSNLYRICYSPWGQEFSICNYWHAWRKNFLRLGRLVLIGGPDDGVITPWQSSFFGFYDANETVLEMEKQLVYLRDSFGLKTLLARGAIVRCPMAGISHTAWHSNRTLYETCIEPWLS